MCLRRDCAVRAVSTALCNQPIHDLIIMRVSFKDNGKSGCGVVIKGIDLSVLWLMDEEMVSDSRKNEPERMSARTWRARKGSMEVMTSRSWHYHGMNHNAMRTRTYERQKFWRDNISDKEGHRDNIPNAPAVPKTITFFYAMTVMDNV